LLPKVTHLTEEEEAAESKGRKGKSEGSRSGDGAADEPTASPDERAESATEAREPAWVGAGAGLHLLTQTPECAQWLLQVAAALAVDAAAAAHGASAADAQVRRAAVQTAVAAARAAADATGVAPPPPLPPLPLPSTEPKKPPLPAAPRAAPPLPSVSLVVCPGASAPGEAGLRLAAATDAVTSRRLARTDL
jgi:hypothetical protein